MNAILERHAQAASVLPKARLVIGDADISQTSAGEVAHVNPTTGREQGRVVLAGRAEVDAAVRSARTALPAWRALAPARRRDLIAQLADLLRNDAERLATIASVEHGATRLGFQHFQMPVICDWFTYYAGWADKLDGSFSGGSFDLVIPEPYGVIGAILPWNAPLAALAMKGAPALAAGNTLVVKPPESAPFLALRFAELAREAGFPSGVINIVTGGAEAGDALVRHPGVDKITFTGSPLTGRRIQAAAADTLTPVVFELGGKSASIVFPDADLERTTLHAATFPFTNAGQICVSPSRLIVHADIYDSFAARIAAIAGALSVGDPLDEGTFMGPMFAAAARDRVLGYIDRAAERSGVSILAGGRTLADVPAHGWFVPPTVISDDNPHSEIAQTELFGPVVVMHRFSSEEEAIQIANATDYGLAGYVHTGNIDRAIRLSRAIRAGGIYVNGSFPVANPNLPFGGIGASGYGREGGRVGIDEFVRSKSVSIQVAGV